MQKGKNIRSVKFNDKKVADKDFRSVITGHLLIQTILIISLGIIASLLCGIINNISTGLVTVYINDFIKSKVLSAFFIIITGLYLYVLHTTNYNGFANIRIIVLMLVLVGFGGLLTNFVNFSQISQSQSSLILSQLFLLGLSIVFAWLTLIITAFTITFNHILLNNLGQFISCFITGLIATFLSLIFAGKNIAIQYLQSIFSIFLSIIVIMVAQEIAKKAIRGSPNFAWIYEKAVFWAATGGTSFYGVDLTDACFDGADLRHTDFRKANLTRASFKGATGLELARTQGTILENTKVRKLLTTNNGVGEDLTGLNLCGANLKNANLKEAILVKTQLLDADLSGATLTDACIQDWNINKNTCFQEVECQKVYLKRSDQGHFLEPKPDSGEFLPGEFEKWITDVRDTIDLIFQNGLNWRAFVFSLTQTAINNEGLDLAVHSIENKGDGVVVAKVGVSVQTNKSAIHEEITNNYYQAVQAIESKYELVLKAKDGEIARLKEFHDSQQQFIQGLIMGIAETKREVIIKGEGNHVYMMNQAGDIMESNNQNIQAGGNVDMSNGNRITVGGDVTNSNLTLADANSQVSNSIQQLRDISTDNSDELAKILAILQKSITDDQVLSDNQKKEALEAVETIAEEGKKPPAERIVKFCSMAINALNGLTSAVTDTSKLAEAMTTYLPTLTKILGI